MRSYFFPWGGAAQEVVSKISVFYGRRRVISGAYCLIEKYYRTFLSHLDLFIVGVY